MPNKKMLFGICTAVALVLTGGAVASAAGDGANHARPTGGDVSTKAVGTSTGGGCGMGYDTETAENKPPDDSTTNNAPAAVVTLKKTCPGAVVANFTSELSTPTASDFIHVDMRATCTATGGLSMPCTVGQEIFGSPGHTFLQHGAATKTTGSMQMVWTGLKRGVWKFEVLPGGNNVASLQFRTFVVEAFAGG